MKSSNQGEENMEEWQRNSAEGRETPDVPEKGWQKLKRHKELGLLLVAVLGVVAILYPYGGNPVAEVLSPDTQPLLMDHTGDVRQRLTKEVEQIVSQIEGIGQVKVCLTLASEGMREYARNQTEERSESKEPSQDGTGLREETRDTSRADVAVSGNGALLVEAHAPQVVGVLVVAEGAENAVLQQRICDAVAVLFDISPHRIRVLSGRRNQA